jgi:hypothetical protein
MLVRNTKWGEMHGYLVQGHCWKIMWKSIREVRAKELKALESITAISNRGNVCTWMVLVIIIELQMPMWAVAVSRLLTIHS